MKAEIEQMLVLQDKMNRKVHPTWFSQGFAWHRACWGEAAELFVHLYGDTGAQKWLVAADLMEAFGWKWWKHQSTDTDRVAECLQILANGAGGLPAPATNLDGKTPQEAVDHLAQALLTDQKDTVKWMPIVSWLAKEQNNGFGDVEVYEKERKAVSSTDDKIQAQIELVDIFHFVLSILLTRYNATVAAEEIQKARIETAGMTPPSLTLSVPMIAKEALEGGRILHPFFHACDALDLSLEELHKRYVQKNVLNFFRQDNGYKTGDYIKIWNGKEDNQVLEKIADGMNTSDESFPEDLYRALEIEYSMVKV